MRLCIVCNKYLDDNEFYYLNNSGTGTCKECTRKRVRENRKNKIEYYREQDRKRSNLPHRIKARKEYQQNNPDKFRAYKEKWKKNNPQKYKAHIESGNKLRDGKLTKQPCLICGDPNSQKHHEDYSKPLDVIWLCPKHHAELHKNRRKKSNGTF